MYVNMCTYIFALAYDYVIAKTILRLYIYWMEKPLVG